MSTNVWLYLVITLFILLTYISLNRQSYWLSYVSLGLKYAVLLWLH